MEYTISQLAQRYGLQPHTLRYYEKEGILSPSRAPSGVRRYSEEDAAQLETALCLKSTGMALKDIRRYFELVARGDDTLNARIRMFTEHRGHVLEEIDTMRRYLRKIERKIAWLEGEREKRESQPENREK